MRLQRPPELALRDGEVLREEPASALFFTGLLGSWSATRWQYTRRAQPEAVVDAICDLRGTITLSLSPGYYILTWEIPGVGARSIGGGCNIKDNQIEFLLPARGWVESVAFQVGAGELTLRSDASAWDFDGRGREESALFVAVFVKL